MNVTRLRHRLPAVPLAAVLIAICLFQIRIASGQTFQRSLETRIAISEIHNREQNRRIEDVEKRQSEFEKAFATSQVQYAEMRLRIEYLLWITGSIAGYLLVNTGNALFDLLRKKLLDSGNQKHDTKD